MISTTPTNPTSRLADCLSDWRAIPRESHERNEQRGGVHEQHGVDQRHLPHCPEVKDLGKQARKSPDEVQRKLLRPQVGQPVPQYPGQKEHEANEALKEAQRGGR